MNDDLYHDELLMRYLDGELNDEERRQFELDMNNDPALKARLTEMQVAIEALRQVGTAEKVRGLHKKMMSEALADEEKSERPIRRIIRYSMAIAASAILVVAALGIYTYQLSSEKIYDDHFLNYTTSVSRGSLEYPSKTPELFLEGKYQEIVDQSKTYTPVPADQLLIAVSYLNLNRPLEAIDILKLLRKNNDLMDDVDYYLGMAYLKNNDADGAWKELKRIHENDKHPYHGQVSGGLIRELRLLTWRN